MQRVPRDGATRAPRERRGQDEGRRALSWGRFSQGFRPLGLMTARRAALCPPCPALGLLLSVFLLRLCWAAGGRLSGASCSVPVPTGRLCPPSGVPGHWASSPWVRPVSVMSSGHRLRPPPWCDIHTSSLYGARPGASLGEAAGEVGFRVHLWPCGCGPGPDCQRAPQAWPRIALVSSGVGRGPGHSGSLRNAAFPSLLLPSLLSPGRAGPPLAYTWGMRTRRVGEGRERARWGWGARALGGAVQQAPVLDRSSVVTALLRGC